ncbi:hypothetical protein A3Q56_07156, partial [Intoshia linei]
MNWKDLEINCKRYAYNQVCELIKYSEDLEKLDHFIQKHAKLKDTADQMLKTAIQSQSDGVRSGLRELNVSLANVDSNHKNFIKLNRMYGKIDSVSADLQLLKIENDRHTNFKNCKNNLEEMIDAPKSIREVTIMISEENAPSNLLEISKKVFRIERMRHDILLEMHAKSQQEGCEYSSSQGYIVIESYFKELSKLYDTLWGLLAMIFEEYQNYIVNDPCKFVSALRIVEKESIYDGQIKKIVDSTGFTLSSRPLSWKNKLFR